MVEVSAVVTIVYATSYTLVFIVTSIYCAWEVLNRQQIENDIANNQPSDTTNEQLQSTEQSQLTTITIQHKIQRSVAKEKQSNLLKEWAKSVWIKKKIYWAIVPHIFDQATDLGTVLAYYQAWKNDKGDQSFNPFWFFFFSLFIIIFQRFISTITIYAMTHNPMAALLQFVDILMVKAVWVNYQLGLNSPGNPQRYIQLLEAVFESSPQIILSMGFIMKSTLDNKPIDSIVIISSVFSIWTLTSKVSQDDKTYLTQDYKNMNFKLSTKPPFFKCNWRYLIRRFLWRFLEITSRICFCVLFWLNIGGIPMIVVLGTELIVFFMLCIIKKTPDHMQHVMYLAMVSSDSRVYFFWTYRVLSFYPYMIMITIFALTQIEAPLVPQPESRYHITINNRFGFFMLIYTWVAGFVWQFVWYILLKTNKVDMDSASVRDIRKYIRWGKFKEAQQLLRFGYVVRDNDVDRRGWTLMHVLCGSYYKKAKNFHWKDVDMKIFEECFEANSNHISKSDKKGNIPLHYAMAKGDLIVIKYLLNNGNVYLMNVINHKGQTPIVYAASFNDEANTKRAECIKYLIEQGVEMFHKDDDGHDVLSYIKKNQYPILSI